MKSEQTVEISGEKLVLDKKTLRAAHIGKKARIVITDHSIIVLAESDERNRDNPVDRSFGIVKAPRKLAYKIAMSKDLENDL